MNVASLCSGYGGLEIAVETLWPDAVTICHAEVDPWASKVLAAHWPGVPNVGDLNTVDWKEVNRMGAPRNDELAQSLYDRYCQGLSIEAVAAESGRSRQTVWKMFNRRGWDMRPRPPVRPTVEFNGRPFSLRDNGYYAATGGDREFLHRVIWQHHNGTLPVGWDVHHRDHDKTNNDPLNLDAMPKADHTRLHGMGEVMPTDTRTIDILTAGYP